MQIAPLQILLDMYNQHKVYLGEKQRAFIVSSYLNSKIPYDPGESAALDVCSYLRRHITA